MGNAQAPTCFLVEVQARGALKVGHNPELLVLNTKVALDGANDSKPIFNILVDALGLDHGAAAIVARDNAKLELLKVLVAVLEPTDEQVALEVFGQEAIEVPAFELERVVLADVDLGDALVVTKSYRVTG